MTLLSILGLGFFLGMRHATDSDHVITVTTIVSRQREVGSAALTGIYWGIGHSIMLLAVGFSLAR
jgi:high-affinity nickel permease